MNQKFSDFHYVVFSDDWGRHPSSCQHIFKRVIPRTKVIWVNTIGLRTPGLSIYDIKRGIEVLKRWFGAHTIQRPVAEKLSVDDASPSPIIISPIMLPFYQWRWARKLNSVFIYKGVLKAIQRNQLGKPLILVSTLPIVQELFKNPLFHKKVFYCVDDFSQWPGVNGKIMLKLERETIPHVDVLIAVSQSLYEKRYRSVKNTYLVTHGVDAPHFRSASKITPALEISRMRKPVLGFVGVLDERMDIALLSQICDRFKYATIVMIGPVDTDISQLRQLPNIQFLGPRPYLKLPALMAGFDVCILPYAINRYTQNINPLKLKEYIATGKPVICTPLREALELKKFLHIADKSAFCEKLKSLLEQSPETSAGLENFLKEESWEKKAKLFFNAILNKT